MRCLPLLSRYFCEISASSLAARVVKSGSEYSLPIFPDFLCNVNSKVDKVVVFLDVL